MKGIAFTKAYMSFLVIVTSVSANMYTKRTSYKDYETKLKTRNL